MTTHPEIRKANIGVSHGLGRRLMAFAESQAQARCYNEMRLATHVLLTENLSLYTHLGWSEYDRDEQRVYMRKRLEGSYENDT